MTIRLIAVIVAAMLAAAALQTAAPGAGAVEGQDDGCGEDTFDVPGGCVFKQRFILGFGDGDAEAALAAVKARPEVDSAAVGGGDIVGLTIVWGAFAETPATLDELHAWIAALRDAVGARSGEPDGVVTAAGGGAGIGGPSPPDGARPPDSGESGSQPAVPLPAVPRTGHGPRG